MHEIVAATETLVAKLFAAGHPEIAGLMAETAETLMAMLDTLAEAGLLDGLPEPVSAH